eukprot:scaffold1208_cov113-Isochrysis_galbana.AAC.1
MGGCKPGFEERARWQRRGAAAGKGRPGYRERERARWAAAFRARGGWARAAGVGKGALWRGGWAGGAPPPSAVPTLVLAHLSSMSWKMVRSSNRSTCNSRFLAARHALTRAVVASPSLPRPNPAVPLPLPTTAKTEIEPFLPAPVTCPKQGGGGGGKRRVGGRATGTRAREGCGGKWGPGGVFALIPLPPSP